jgi:multidrug efflux pump subunit AcrA (membrane-fusion protein)
MNRILLVAIIFLFACNRKQEETIKPVIQNITESVYASGVVKSKNQYQVFSTVNGILAQKKVREGDTVRKGDVLVTLLNEAQRLNSENAELAATYSSVAYNADRLDELKINIDLARAKMQNDSALFQRQQNLWKQEIGTRNELEQRELAWKNSKTNYESARLKYNNLKKEIDFRSQQSQKNLQISKSTNQDYSIRARQDGRVYSILKEPGELVTPQTPIAVVGDVNEFVMELQVDEYDISRIKTGQKVFVSMDSYKGEVFEATVTKIQPIMDNRLRSFEIEAIFNSKPPDLYPNLTVEANILISTRENAMTIPRNYLTDKNEVYLKNGDIRKVVTGLKDYQRVEIISGLSKDDVLKLPAE